MRRAVCGSVAAALLLSGCSGGDHGVPGPGAGGAATWLVEQLNSEGLSADDRAYFSPELGGTSQWPEVTSAVRTVAEDGPWTVVDEVTEGTVARRVLRSSAGRTLLLHLEREGRGPVDVLWFGPAIDRAVATASAHDVRRVADALPVQWSATSLRPGDERVRTVGSAGDAPLPMASVAKVVIAAGVARAIEQGRLTPQRSVRVAQRDRSVPLTRGSPSVGERRTVDELVALMLRTSDNTAADVLLRLVGQEGVRSVWREATGRGWSGPFLSTKQVLEGGWGTAAVPQGADLDDPPTRSGVARLATSPVTVDPRAVTTPRWQDGLDWVARSSDVAAVGAWLLEHRRVLGAETRGVLDDDFVKPGGAPGVVAELRWTIDGAGATVTVRQFAGESTSDVGDAEGLLLLADRTLEVDG